MQLSLLILPLTTAFVMGCGSKASENADTGPIDAEETASFKRMTAMMKTRRQPSSPRTQTAIVS